jgi:23S rRNA pseudouridine1911/1915/1917 synthase
MFHRKHFTWLAAISRGTSEHSALAEEEFSVTIETFVVAREDSGERLDRYVAARLPEISRTRLQELIAEGSLLVNGEVTKRSHHVRAGETIAVQITARPPLAATPENIPLQILYEDDDIIVVNKPAGMVVHAGAGQARGTLVNALLHHRAQLSTTGGDLRPGIVHRLDRGTSGTLIVARNDAAHKKLADQFRARKIEKRYIALVHGTLERDTGRIELPIARDPRRRTRMTARRQGALRHARDARTDWRVLARIDHFTLVEVDLHTGRTHQIRVHFSALRHPVVGDRLYGAPKQVRAGTEALPPLERNFLHAARIGFTQPSSGKWVVARAPLPEELRQFLEKLAESQPRTRALIDAALRPYL